MSTQSLVVFFSFFFAVYAQAQSENYIRYELITPVDTLLVEFRQSTLGSQLIWGKKTSDSTMIPSASLLIKADEPQKLWKLDYRRKFFTPLMLSDFPVFPVQDEFKVQKDEYSKGERKLLFMGNAGQVNLSIDTSKVAPAHFHDFLAWHLPVWKSGALKISGGLQTRGIPSYLKQSPAMAQSWQAKTLRLKKIGKQEAFIDYYLIPGDWMPTGIPSGNTPGSPIQIVPNEDKSK